MKKRIIPLLLCLVMVAAVLMLLPAKANAATAQETGNAILENVLKQDGTFPETLPEGQTTHSAYCYVCKAEKEWKPLTKAMSNTFSSGDHYYIPKNGSLVGQVFQMNGQTVCVHTNGKTLTDTSYRFAIVGGKATMNIMGAGTISANPGSGVRGAIFVNNSTLNIYGTKIISASAVNLPVLSLYNSGAVVNAWNATLDAGTKPTITTNGTVNLYNCTAIGAAVTQDDSAGGNGSTAKINLVDSTLPGIKSEIGTVTVSGATKITGTGLALAAGKTIDPTKLTEGASIAIASEGVFTATGMQAYAKYFTSADTGLKFIAKQDGSLANMGAEEYGYEVVARANALTGKFPTDGTSTYEADCPACGKTNATWKPMTAKPGGSETGFENNGHYFLPNNLSLGGQVIRFDRNTTACVHMNGKTFTDTSSRFVMVANSSTFNLMGGGVLQCNTAGNRGSVYTNNGTANIYGVTIKNTATAVHADGNAAITLYNTADVVNVWSSKLEGSTVSPVILANGAVNLYNCTATGIAAQIGGYAGRTDTNAALNLYDSSVTGVDQKNGKITVSGSTKITGSGLALLDGKTIDPSELTAGAEVLIADECVITGSGMADYAKYFKAAKAGQEITVSADGTLRCWEPKALLVDANGRETVPDDLLTAWASGNYAYIKLYGKDALAMSGQEIVVDLNGFDLTVTGSGKIRVFDTANDSYDEHACGVLLNNGTVTVEQSFVAPNGGTYVAVTESNCATAHRLDIKLTSVTLRTAAAGLYYKAQYDCDSVLAEKVKAYGVIVSVANMPGADYANDGNDVNKYTIASAPFQSGVTATSGSIFGIMKADNSAAVNAEHARIPIYANAYIDLGNGPIVADIVNPGKKVGDEGFNGVALSLYDVLGKLDDAYNNYNTTTRLQLDSFYAQWKDKGMDWDFKYIGQTAGATDGIDNSNLVFDAGTTNAICPVCKVKVTWTELTVKDTHQNLNGHYYLSKDLTFENTGDAFFFNSTKNTTLCVHLNGHNLTATQTRVVHGSSGRTNIMGNGIVTGYQKSADYAAAVQINNTVGTQSVHLYGGTYKKTSNSSASAVSVGISNAGGNLFIYEGAIIENAGKTAIIVRTPTNVANSTLVLYGCTVNGNVQLMGADPTKNSNTCTVELVDCNINGNVDIALYNDVYLSGAPVIKSITRHEDVRLNTKVLTEGASIGIANDGIFTVQSESVKNYIGYFHGADAADVITVRDNALHCGPDYTGNLKFAEGTTDAMCPACAKVVTWEAVDGTQQLNNSTEKKTKHYYLTENTTYTANNSAILSYIDPGHGSHTVCFHLNGHDLTLTDTRLVYGGTSTTNVMGTGVVTGVRSDGYSPGGLIQINVGNETGTINLYSGTYRHGENGAYKATDYTISISGNGGTVNIYEDALVEANSNGRAIYVGNSNLRSSKLGIYGTVNGNIYSVGAKTFTTTITVDNGTVNGTMDLDGVSDLILSQAAKIQLLDMEETSLATLDRMKPGADITIAREGVFTKPHASAAQWAEYFSTANSNDLIDVKENALRYKVDYSAEIRPDAEGKAYCPVCKEDVVWTAVTNSDQIIMTQGEHRYLTTDILFEEAYNGNSIVAYLQGGTTSKVSNCFHLNGHNITATKAHAIFGGYGVLNIMGEGVVTGYAKAEKYGGAVHINNSVAGNCVKLYSGTYRNADNSVAGSGVATLWTQGSGLTIYEDADISNPNGLAIYTDISKSRNSNLEIYGATINGNVVIGAPTGETYKAQVILDDATINGEMTVAAGNEITFDGRTKINKLNIAAGQLITFTDMREGSDITVSADGIFSGVMPLADEWLKYITCADAGDWIIVRDKQFYQEVKQQITAATDDDKTALNTTYKDKTVKYGDMHDHSSATERADGNYTLAQWKAEMDRLGMDFATLADHGQSQHMYHPDWDPTYFVGGSEPGTTITDSKANPNKPHYNMVFSDKDKLEALVLSWATGTANNKFKISYNKSDDSRFTEGLGGFLFSYPSYTTAEFARLTKDVYEAGGLLVHVHPKYDSYLNSNDPLDYFFADYSGFEISTGNGGSYNMMYKDNNEAYETWVDLLELGKKIWATAGSDAHKLPNIGALTTMYTDVDHAETYMEHIRTGNFAPGWVGIRMNINGTAMGGETDFTGNRLQFSVGDIYNSGVKDSLGTPNPYVEGHTYRVELYDDGGLLMSSTIDPTQMNYFAIDCDATAKFYRVVVWDETDNERIGVSNPIWNTAAEEE